MTPEQQNKIEAIKAALKQHIEEAEKATIGPWEIQFSGNGYPYRIKAPKGDDQEPGAVGTDITRWNSFTMPSSSEGLANAAFIARARTMSPLACKIALAGIECAEQHSALAFVYGIPSTETQVQHIIDIWEGGQP